MPHHSPSRPDTALNYDRGERLLTPREVSHWIRIAPQTLARWRSEGRGPRFLRAHRRILYRPQDIASWLQQQLASSTAEASRLRDDAAVAAHRARAADARGAPLADDEAEDEAEAADEGEEDAAAADDG